MLGNFLLAYLVRLFFALLVYLRNSQVVLGCDPDDGAQRLYNGSVLDHVVTAGAVGDLEALAGLDDDLLACLNGLAVWGKEVALAPIFEFYAYNFSQLFSSFPLPAVTSPPAIQIYA